MELSLQKEKKKKKKGFCLPNPCGSDTSIANFSRESGNISTRLPAANWTSNYIGFAEEGTQFGLVFLSTPGIIFEFGSLYVLCMYVGLASQSIPPPLPPPILSYLAGTHRLVDNLFIVIQTTRYQGIAMGPGLCYHTICTGPCQKDNPVVKMPVSDGRGLPHEEATRRAERVDETEPRPARENPTHRRPTTTSDARSRALAGEERQRERSLSVHGTIRFFSFSFPSPWRRLRKGGRQGDSPKRAISSYQAFSSAPWPKPSSNAKASFPCQGLLLCR